MTYTTKIVNGVPVLLSQQEIDDLLARDAATVARPDPPPLGTADKLAKIGITVRELKDLLGIQ